MTQPLAYLNGHFLPRSQTMLAIHDAGFVFGATITDFCRTFRHELFRLDDHLKRFRFGCEHVGIELPAHSELAEVARKLIRNNGPFLPPEDDLGLVFFATPGPLGAYSGDAVAPADGPPTLGMHTFPLRFDRSRQLFQTGARLVVPSVRQVPADCINPCIKQRSRLHWLLAEREARRIDPGASALLLDHAGHVTETAVASFLIVENGTVVSPPAGNVLGGVSLTVVRELCHTLNIPCIERPLQLAECLAAEEAMLSNTSFCLAGVSRLAGVMLPWPGPITVALGDAWSRLVGFDYRAQILAAR